MDNNEPNTPTPTNQPHGYTPLNDEVSPQPTVVNEEADPFATQPTTAGAEVEPPTTQPIAPVFPSADIEPPTAPITVQGITPKKSKKPLIIGGIVAAIVVILGAGSALAYNLVYQNPDKVIGDSLVNAMKASSITSTGDISITSKDSDVKVNIQGIGSHKDGTVAVAIVAKTKDFNLDLKGEGTYVESGDMYVRVKDFKKSYDQLLISYVDSQIKQFEAKGPKVSSKEKDQIKTVLDRQFGPIVTKIDNQWIKISASDLGGLNKNSGASLLCLTDAYKKIQNDKAASSEVSNLYQKDKFLIVKQELGSKDGSLGYLVDVNNDASKKFNNDLKNTAFGKELDKCNKANSASTDSSSAQDSVDNTYKDNRIEVWSDRWSHQMTKFSFTGTSSDGQKIESAFSTQFNKPISIVAPKDSMTLKQLKDDLSTVESLLSA